MTTFESAITRAESDLVHVQSALETAQHVLEAAGQAHSTGRRLLKSIRIVVIVLAIGGIAVTAVMILDRLLDRNGQGGDRASEVAPIDQIQNMEQL